ncbi:hypothetical protein R2362_03060 [Mycobacteroides chelonae]|nr:hypothetical protein [Mycobacteroides chelonae]
MAEFIAAQAAVLMVPSIKGFHSKLKTALETVRQDLTIQVKAQTKEMLAEISAAKKVAEATPIDLRVKVHDKEYIKQITEIRHKYENLGSQFRKGLTLNIAVTGAQLLPQLGVAVAALNESIVSLSQNALLLPGAFSAAAASIGTLLLGTRGLKDAFKAYGDAQKSAVEDSRRLRDAQRAVTDANRDYARALKDSQRNLRDLNLEMKGARLSEAEAILNVREAEADAAKAFGKSALERQRDILRVQQAEQRLEEVRNRNKDLAQDTAEANAKGVAGSDAVVGALDRLKNAQEGVQEANKGQRGLADALGKLSPNARSFVAAMQGLRGSYGGLRSDLQDRIFANLDRDVVALAGKSLPMLRRGLGSIGDGWNRNIRTMVAELGSDSNQGLIGKILGNTGEAQSRLSNAIKPFTDAFLRLGAIGSNFLPRLSNGFAHLMGRFDAFVQRSEKSGKMDEWINRAIEAAKNFGNSLINIGSIMNSVTEAFLGSGGKGFLQWFQEATKRLSDYLKTADGQQRLIRFFKEARAELDKLRPLLASLPDLMRNIGDAVQTWSDIMLPFVKTAAGLLAGHKTLVTAIFVAYASWKTITPIISGAKYALEVFGATVKNVQAAVAERGLLGAVKNLAGSLATGGVLASALVAAGGVLYVYQQKQEAAATAAQRHKEAIANLRTELDGLSGDLTQKGLLEKLDRLGSFKQKTGNNSDLDIPQLASDVGTDRGKLAQILTPSQGAARDAELGRLDKITEEGLVSTDYWKKNHAQFEKVGITSDVLAKALGGDKLAVEKFNAAFAAGQVPGGGPASLHPESYTLADIQRGANRLGKQVLAPLPDRSQKSSQVSGAVRDDVSDSNDTTNNIRQNNAAVGGGATGLKPGNPFSGLGVDNSYRDPVAGGGVIVVNTPYNAFPPDLRKNIESNGGSVQPLAGGKSQITLSKERFELYAGGRQYGPPVPRAGGGMMFGPGSGTSDSILARLSNGEFVTKASSVAKYGPDLFHALNAGKIDPAALPGFDEGGPVFIGGSPTPLPRKIVPHDIPDTTNPGLYDPATGTYSGGGARNFYKDWYPGGDSVTAGPIPAPSPNSPIDTGRLTGGSSIHSGTGTAPGPDASTLVPDVPAYAPEIAQNYAPQGIFGGFGAIDGLPDSIQPVNILAQIGEILLGAVLSFFGIDPTYFNLGKQAIQGIAKAPGFQNSVADPQVAELLKPGALPSNVANKSPLSPENPIYDGLGSGSMKAIEFAQQHAIGQKYVYAGVGNFDGTGVDGYDCSGISSAIYAAATGKPQGVRYFNTESDFEKLGFVPGYQPGALNIGVFRGGGGPNSHMAVTLPNGVAVESGGSHGSTAYGGAARGADTFPLKWHLPLPEGFRAGGILHGPGSGTSDSMLARVSNGEFVTRAASVAKYGPDLFHALNEGKIDPSMLPGFDDGGQVLIPGIPAPPPDPGQAAGPLPDAPPPVDIPATGPSSGPTSTVGAPTEGVQAPAPVTEANPTPDVNAPAVTEQATDSAVGEAMGGIGAALKGTGGGVNPGAAAPQGAKPDKDPRSVLGAAPKNLNHNNPGLQKGIEGAASAIGGALSTAISVAASAGSFGAAGPAGGAAGSLAAAGVQMGGQAVAGAANILSSLLVGTLTGGSTANPSGVPMLPQEGQKQAAGPRIVNNFNGGIHTSNLEQWNQNQQRREAQQAASYMGPPSR